MKKNICIISWTKQYRISFINQLEPKYVFIQSNLFNPIYIYYFHFSLKMHIQVQKSNSTLAHSIYQQIIKLVQPNSHLICSLSNQLQYISKSHHILPYKQLQPQAAPNPQGSTLTRLRHSEEIIIIQIFGIGKIDKSKIKYNYLDLIAKVNESLCKEQVVFWVEQNSNFAIRKTINWELIRLNNLLQIRNYLGKCQKALQEIFNKCMVLAVNGPEQNINMNSSEREAQSVNPNKNPKQQQEMPQQQEQNKKKPKNHRMKLKKKVNNIEHLKYQFEINRRKNPKSSIMDFNNSKLKSLSDIIALKQYCTKNNKNYVIALRQNYSKSNINPLEAEKVYLDCLQSYKKKLDQQNKAKSSADSTPKIIGSIGIIQETIERNCQIQATFSHIQIVKSKYEIYLSKRQSVNHHLALLNSISIQTQQSYSSQSTKSDNSQNQENIIYEDTLVKKNKCMGCLGQSQERKKINQIVFQNEKQILLIFLDRYHPSICEYFIKQYIKKQDITSFYSRMLPYSPIQLYFLPNNIINSFKFLRKSIKFLLQLSEGINFLVNNQIIHRDLKPTNILLDKNHDVKIIDLGSACPYYSSTMTLSKGFDFTLRSSPGYYCKYSQLVQEVKGKYSQQQYYRHQNFDMFSLGVIIEKICQKIPKVEEVHYELIVQNLNYLGRKCRDWHPDDRIVAGDVTMFLYQLSDLGRILWETL